MQPVGTLRHGLVDETPGDETDRLEHEALPDEGRQKQRRQQGLGVDDELWANEGGGYAASQHPGDGLGAEKAGVAVSAAA